ncbi:hypothetical protein DMA11_05815 [Marinilabiliaceae bacterium JC017]|nr:hypothetical protein DMA11_05815 [Marinilabiliaceae bacterium JC017]
MKLINLFLSLILLTGTICACNSQTDKKNTNNVSVTNDQVKVYYFHYTRRCATCQAVEKESQKFVTELYGNKVEFADFNLDEEKGKEAGKSLKVSGQSLLIVSGEKIINITNEGFMHARSNPEKLKAIIKEKIDSLL